MDLLQWRRRRGTAGYGLKLNKSVKVFTSIPGACSETYRFIEQVRDHYGIAIEIMTGSGIAAAAGQRKACSVSTATAMACCGIRKIEPLRRKLSTVPGPPASGATRARHPARLRCWNWIARSRRRTPLYKFNPLAQMTSEEVWGYIRMLEIPYNSLHERGFHQHWLRALHRPVLPNQHEREGRWWWEEATHRNAGCTPAI